MAGIGFKLQKLFQEDYFSSRMKAYLYAGLVTAGPWLIVILTISILRWLSINSLPVETEQRNIFNLSVSYAFIFSQVILGVQQLVVTRYLADQFYEKRFDRIFPAFIGMSKITVALATVVWIVFAVISPLDLLYKLVLFVLFLLVNLIWVLFLFLSAAKFYQAVAYSFLAGGAMSIGLVVALSHWYESLAFLGLSSSMWLLLGFTSGIFVTFLGLTFSIFVTFPDRSDGEPYSYFGYFDRYPALFWTGFLYNIGIWVCNWIIWFGDDRQVVASSFVYNFSYDTAIFWSYLTIIPTLIIFVVSVETRFYERYRVFYSFVNFGGTLEQIKVSMQNMNQVLKEEIERLLRGQGMITFLIILFSPFLISLLGVSGNIESIFLMTTVGAFANGMVLVLTLLLLYFEDQKGAMLTSVLFLAGNALLTFSFMPLGASWYGTGFAIGSTLAFAFAGLRLIHYMRKIDYYAYCEPNYGFLTSRRLPFTRLGERLNRLG